MAKVPSIVPVSDLRQDAAGVLKRTRSSNEPVFITQRGRATAVLMSIEAFETFRQRARTLAPPGPRRAGDREGSRPRPREYPGRSRRPPHGRVNMRVRFTATPRAQFLAAIEAIRRKSPQATRAFRQRSEKALKRLERFHGSGTTVAEFPDLPFREVFIPPYRFFYTSPRWDGLGRRGLAWGPDPGRA